MWPCTWHSRSQVFRLPQVVAGIKFPRSLRDMDLVAVGVLLLLLLDQPVLNDGRGCVSRNTLVALNLDGHGLVLLQARGEIGLLGRSRSLGKGEGGDLANGVRVLDGDGLVGLELLEVELLDEVRCKGNLVSFLFSSAVVDIWDWSVKRGWSSDVSRFSGGEGLVCDSGCGTIFFYKAVGNP